MPPPAPTGYGLGRTSLRARGEEGWREGGREGGREERGGRKEGGGKRGGERESEGGNGQNGAVTDLHKHPSRGDCCIRSTAASEIPSSDPMPRLSASGSSPTTTSDSA